MECQAIQERMLAEEWSASRLEEAAAIAAHLASCDECRRALADYERLRGVLAVPAEDRDAGGDRGGGAMRRALESAAPSRNGNQFSLWRVALATAACVAMAAGGWALRGLAVAPSHESSARSSLAGGSEPGPVVNTLHQLPTSNRAKRHATPSINEAFSPDEVRASEQVFAGVNQALDGRAGWVAQSGKRSEVGLASSSMAGVKQLLLLRLTMSHNGEVASQSDISIVPGQAANLTVGLGSEMQLEYHISTTAEPPRLALWAEIKSPRDAGQMLGALATNLPVSPGRVVEAGELVTASGAYELRVAFSTAAMPTASKPPQPVPGKENGS